MSNPEIRQRGHPRLSEGSVSGGRGIVEQAYASREYARPKQPTFISGLWMDLHQPPQAKYQTASASVHGQH